VLRPRELSRAAARSAGAGPEKRRVVIFGSGGPVAAALAEELQADFVVRQTDARSLAEIRAANKPQSEGAPLPPDLPAPHEERVVDVRDFSQVLAACEGMDAIVNCSVIRPDAVEAFRVNTLGAYNVVRAAVERGITRVVQTGPQQMAMDESTGYWWDYDVPGNAPARPGRNLYAHSKYLGQEICRVFAENNGLEIPVLVYAQFLNPEVTHSVWTMAVSWRDSARALRRAVEVASLRSPYEEMAITSDLPTGKFSAARAKEVLGWEAEDDLSALWAYRE
jgi:nucleoside-diphosphate-sugar epimerase